MANTTFYQKVSQISPHIEMINRRLYYLLKPIADKFVKKKKQKSSTPIETKKSKYEDVFAYLNKSGLKAGDICIIHSAYGELKQFNLSPQEWIEAFIEYLGPLGTLAMPSIPVYPEPTFDENGHTTDIFTYETSSTKIWTGALPKAMITDPRSIRSEHPLNTMVAIGHHAKEMMINNHTDPYPCGPGSSWNYCYNKNAFILGLGTDLTHSLTMIHVAEDSFVNEWPVNNWYQDRIFTVKSETEVKTLHVKERKYHWGKLHFAERNLSKDLLNSKVMTSSSIDCVLVESLRAKDLIHFLKSKNSKGYPYFWV
jgi:aminoglycoside 3-N-acetyltransferase